jgi:hypothetical protein
MTISGHLPDLINPNPRQRNASADYRVTEIFLPLCDKLLLSCRKLKVRFNFKNKIIIFTVVKLYYLNDGC